MPFDGTDTGVPDLRAPSLPGLAYLLRHPERWPKGFAFDWYNPATCAVGLAVRTWEPRKARFHTLLTALYLVQPRRVVTPTSMNLGTNLGISEHDVAWLFFTTPRRGNPERSIKPEDVADRIDRFLSEQTKEAEHAV